MKQSNFRRLFLSLLMIIISSLPALSQQSLWVGQTYRADYTNLVSGMTYNLSWSTSGGYISLSGSGFYRDITITQYFSGTAYVTCEWDYKLTSSSSLTHVRHQVAITCQDNPVYISPTTMTLSPGETKYVSYHHEWNNNPYVSSANAYFQSSDPTVVTVNERTGEVYAVGSGTTYINVYSKISSVSPYCKVTVKQIDPTSVSLPKTIDMTVGDTHTLTPTLYPSNAQTTYSWSSSDPQVVSVSSSGMITAKKHGTAIITVRTANGKTASCDVTVQKSKLHITASHASGLIESGTAIMLTSDVSDAKIYYTLDGSTPTSNSILYNGSIPLTSTSCVIKAIAVHSDYLDSDILSLNFNTTSLTIVSTSPDLSSIKSAPHLIPCIAFNSSIKESKNFNGIQFLCNQNAVDFVPIINGNKLYMVPKMSLNGKAVSILIDVDAVQNLQGEPNVTICCTNFRRSRKS